MIPSKNWANPGCRETCFPFSDLSFPASWDCGPGGSASPFYHTEKLVLTFLSDISERGLRTALLFLEPRGLRRPAEILELGEMKLKKSALITLTLAAIALFCGNIAKADTITDTTLNVVYTASVGTDASDPAGTQDVTLMIDATGFSQGSGFLTSVAMQFTGATSVSLESATGGTSAWTAITSGGLNSSGCNSTGNFVCTQNLTANLPIPASGVYTFVFEVTGLTGTSSDVKAAYNTAADNSGKNLGLTSMGISLAPPVSTPEPATLSLLGMGMFGLVAVARRRLQKP
jgi:PEP-CTERM motif-containing protein